jgi:aminomethyltransferase
VAANDVAYPVLKDGRSLGKMTSWVYSPRLEKNIGFAMLPVAALGGELEIDAPEGRRAAQVVQRPFIDPKRKLSRGTEEGGST